MLSSEQHGKGIIIEAIKATLDYGFKIMKLHAIKVNIDPKNLTSERVLQKTGFMQVHHLKENEFLPC